MAKKRSRKGKLPSFEEVTAKPLHPETAGRLHPSALPKRKPPGEMRVHGRNPALFWLEGLSRSNPALGDALLERLENLSGAARRQAIWTAYTKHFYRGDSADETNKTRATKPPLSPKNLLEEGKPFDYSSLFDEPPS